MAAWSDPDLVPSLRNLGREFDALSPGRSRASDGARGDLAHQQSTSSHNPDETGRTPYEDADSRDEIHAIDVTSAGPWPDGHDMEHSVQTLVRRHRDGLDNRLQNIIYRRRIWSRTWGWTERPYDGDSPHDEHAHCEGRYTDLAESDPRPWGLLEDIVTEQDIDKIVAKVRAGLAPEFAEIATAQSQTTKLVSTVLTAVRQVGATAVKIMNAVLPGTPPVDPPTKA